MKYQFDKLKAKYGNFELPMINVTVEGKGFEQNKAGMIIGDAEVDLTSGYEASEAVYRIYNCTDEKDGTYLYEDLKPYILLGSVSVIEMGYEGALEEVFRGFTARVEFTCGEGEIPCVEVTLMDIKGAMMAGKFEKQLCAASYGEAVKEILQKQVYQGLSSKGLLEKAAVTETPDKNTGGGNDTARVEMTAESDYEFIVKAARKFNYEFYTELGTVYFRKAKAGDTVLMELGLEEGILSYRAAYDIRGIIREAEARGPDDGKGAVISAKESCRNKLSYGSKVNQILDSSSRICIDSSIHTKEEASARAKSVLERAAWQFGSLECECIGIPILCPGYYIEISGLGTGPDNQYYLTGVRHILSGDKGYYTCLRGQAASVK